jgi:hypothetical protein
MIKSKNAGQIGSINPHAACMRLSRESGKEREREKGRVYEAE